MKLRHPTLAMLLVASLWSAPASAAAGDDCRAMQQLISRARSDFPSLRELRMQPGVCSLRSAEYRCAWAFPGDSFGVAEAQSSAMVECAAKITSASRERLKGGKTRIELESDLSLLIADPTIESGQWQVMLRIIAAPANSLRP